VDKDLNAISVFATAAQHQGISSAIDQLDAGAAAPGSPAGSSGTAAYGDSNFDVIDLQSAMPGQNGTPSTTATDIATAVTQLLGQMAPDLRISVPANSSQIMLAGGPTSLKLARDLIERLDRAQPLVVLDTEVLEVDETSARNLGISFPQAVLSSTFQELQPPIDTSSGQAGRLIRLQTLGRSPLQLTAELNLLVQKGNARVLADPRITTVSGHQATIRAGDTISILTQTGGGVGTPVTQQVQSFQTGVTLDITPQVSDTGSVTVMLHPVVNSLTGLLNGVPQIATRDTQTVVQLQDNQTLVIGGLIQDTSQQTINKIPILGDIPVLGKVFQGNDTEHRRNELIIVVTPHILKAGQPEPPPSAVLPIPTPQALPTLSPGMIFPGPTPQRSTPATEAGPRPTTGPTLHTPVPSQSPVPQPTPSAFSNANVFEYGSAPENTFARDADAPKIFYARFSPTLLKNGTPVTAFVITTTNVKKVTIGYQGYTTSLSQVAPSKWQGSYNFNASGFSTTTSPVNLTLSAFRTDGNAATVQIPVNLLQM
jgi:hypothetical protein